MLICVFGDTSWRLETEEATEVSIVAGHATSVLCPCIMFGLVWLQGYDSTLAICIKGKAE